MNPSCWAVSSPHHKNLTGLSENRVKCLNYQDDKLFGTALKFELEYSALLLSSMAEMLRFKSHALDCRVVSLMNTMNQTQNLLKFHHHGAFGRQRDASKTVESGSAHERRGRGNRKCVVKAVFDKMLNMELTTTHFPGCKASGIYTGYCGQTQKELNNCKRQYTQRISDQYELMEKQINATDRAIINLEKKTSRVDGCVIWNETTKR